MMHRLTLLLLQLVMVMHPLLAQQDRPNIVWLVTEDNSKHFMRLYDKGGASMPQIESLAKQGIVFNRAFSNAPVCSVARSTIISGCYAPRIGAQYHRRVEKVRLPDGLQMFPHYLREAGYYTTNNAKEDYNIEKDLEVWDESSNKASYRNRKTGQPFFHVQNFGITHEGKLHFSRREMDGHTTLHDPAEITPFPYHPNTSIFRYTYARLLDHHRLADSLMGVFIAGLKEEGLLENTIVFYYGDHGGVLPRSKGYLYESGLHVPMVVYVPEKWAHLSPLPPGSRTDAFVSFVDLAPTVLNMAGISIPEEMDGSPFLGRDVGTEELSIRNTTFSYADRFDEKYEKIRAIRMGKYKYVRNYQAIYPDALYNEYRYRMLAYSEWKSMYHEGTLNKAQQLFFRPKPAELLFDLEEDPHEITNLSSSAAHQEVLRNMRMALQEQVGTLPDLSFYPEPYLLDSCLPVPAEYGSTHKDEIRALVEVADLALLPFSKAMHPLSMAIASADPWRRYWALTVCSYFLEEATSFLKKAEEIATGDLENLVRFRAAEFMALARHPAGINHLEECLTNANSMIEANLVLNAFANLKDRGYAIPSDLKSRIHPSWRGSPKTLVQRRIDYLQDF